MKHLERVEKVRKSIENKGSLLELILYSNRDESWSVLYTDFPEVPQRELSKGISHHIGRQVFEMYAKQLNPDESHITDLAVDKLGY